MARKAMILVVDDDPEIRRQLRWALNEEYEIQVAADLGEAERKIRNGDTPAAAIVDLHLPPDTDSIEAGISVIRALREASGGTRIIVITADSTEEARRRSQSAGASIFLNKPVERSKVLSALKTMQ
jgi:DNA-binding response OmpR family regulator